MARPPIIDKLCRCVGAYPYMYCVFVRSCLIEMNLQLPGGQEKYKYEGNADSDYMCHHLIASTPKV